MNKTIWVILAIAVAVVLGIWAVSAMNDDNTDTIQGGDTVVPSEEAQPVPESEQVPTDEDLGISEEL